MIEAIQKTLEEVGVVVEISPTPRGLFIEWIWVHGRSQIHPHWINSRIFEAVDFQQWQQELVAGIVTTRRLGEEHGFIYLTRLD